jgi:Flp pilus assembly protein TadG
VLLPVLLLLFLATVQLGTYFYARAVASTAARQGLDAARSRDGTEQTGESAIDQFLSHAGGGLQHPAVVVDRAPEDVTVTVSAGVLSIVPGWQPHVTVTVTAPTERLVA